MAWGTVLEFNDYGQTNPPSGLSNVVLVAAGRYHGMALIYNENPALSWSLRPPALTTNGAALEVPTQRGRLYIVERSDGLHPDGMVCPHATGGKWKRANNPYGDKHGKRVLSSPAVAVTNESCIGSNRLCPLKAVFSFDWSSAYKKS
jgi:hypothetical protein